MPCSVLTRAKRAFVSVLLSLASACGISLEITRDSQDKLLLDAYRRVARKVHPDKGGDKDTFQKLQAAKEAWDAARAKAAPAGNPQLSADKIGPFG